MDDEGGSMKLYTFIGRLTEKEISRLSEGSGTLTAHLYWDEVGTGEPPTEPQNAMWLGTKENVQEFIDSHPDGTRFRIIAGPAQGGVEVTGPSKTYIPGDGARNVIRADTLEEVLGILLPEGKRDNG